MEWIRKYCKTFDRDGAIRSWPEWEFFDDLVSDLELPGVSLWIKSRQMMCSWLVAAYCLHAIIFNPRVNIYVISRNLEQVLDLHSRIEFMHRELPDEHKLNRRTDNMKVFDVEHGADISVIKFSPAGRNAGRGPQNFFFVADEFAFMMFAKEIFIGLKPSIDGGGRGVILSTGNGNTKRNKFAQLIHDRAILGFKYREVHYRLNPEKDAAWQEQARIGLSQAEWDQEHECKLLTLAGLVYSDFTEALHVVDMPQLRDTGKFYASIDFGYNNPFVCNVYYAPTPDYSTFYVVAEHYEAEQLTKYHADMIVPLLCIPRFIGDEFHKDPPPVTLDFNNSFVCDPAGKQQRMDLAAEMVIAIKKYWESKSPEWQEKYPYKPTYKTVGGTTDIRPGIEAVQAKMEVNPRLGHPEFLICRNVNGDVVAPNMVFEFENYSEQVTDENVKTPKNPDENPIKLHDHSMDTNKNLLLKLKQHRAKGHKKKPRGM